MWSGAVLTILVQLAYLYVAAVVMVALWRGMKALEAIAGHLGAIESTLAERRTDGAGTDIVDSVRP